MGVDGHNTVLATGCAFAKEVVEVEAGGFAFDDGHVGDGF